MSEEMVRADLDDLRRRLEATLFREHGPRFLLTAEGWRRRSDGMPVSGETVNREASDRAVARAHAWARWSATLEVDARVLVGAHEPDDIAAWAFIVEREERDLLEALAHLLAAEHQRVVSEQVVPDARLEALARGFWLIVERRRDRAQGIASDNPLAAGIDHLRDDELLEAAAAAVMPRGYGSGDRDAQRRLEYGRRRARRAVE